MLGLGATGSLAERVCLKAEGAEPWFTGKGGVPSVFIQPPGKDYYVLTPRASVVLGSGATVANVTELKAALGSPGTTLVLASGTVDGVNVGAMPTTVGSGGASETGAGSSGPPALASIETSNSQAEELIRQRRENASQTPIVVATVQPPIAQPVQQTAASAVTAQTPVAPTPPAVQASPKRVVTTPAVPSVQAAPTLPAARAPVVQSAPQTTVVTSPVAPSVLVEKQTTPAEAAPTSRASNSIAPKPISKELVAEPAASRRKQSAEKVETVRRVSAVKVEQHPKIHPAKPKSAPVVIATEHAAGTHIDRQLGPIVGTWAQIYLDYEKHRNIAPGTAENTTRVQKTVGQIAGTDLTYRRSSNSLNEAIQFGILGGHHDTRSTFKDTASTTNASQRDEGGFVGGYATYQANRFSLESMLKVDFYQHSARSNSQRPVTCSNGESLFVDKEADASISAFKAGSVDQKNYTTSLNAAYRYDLGNSSYFEPTAGARYTYTDYGSGAADLNLQNGDVLRLQAGARVGTTWNDQGYRWSASVLGLLYSDVMVRGYALNTEGLSSSALRVDQGKIRALGQLNTKVDVGGGLSYNAQVDVRGGQDLVGVGGRAGLRYEW
jgi:hypothetical protein